MTKEISKGDGKLLLDLARQSILQEFKKKENNDNNDKEDNNNKNKLKKNKLKENKLKFLKDKVSPEILKERRGTFVTLHQNSELRGCIGNIEPVKNIFSGIKDNAKYAAFNDSRFSCLSYKELETTTIEISILTKPKKINYSDSHDLITRLKPGIDGVIIQKGCNSATFLPQVWEQLKDPKSFLNHLCTKAGLSSDEWETGDIEVLIYQVQLFEEP